jgi:subtilase-type serine protease
LPGPFDLLKRAHTFTSSDLGVTKNCFANGAATHPSVTPADYVGILAVAPAGYTLPRFNGLPNTTTSVLDIADGVTNPQAGQDVCGRSRPVAAGPTAT